jgi:hypothetical protein
VDHSVGGNSPSGGALTTACEPSQGGRTQLSVLMVSRGITWSISAHWLWTKSALTQGFQGLRDSARKAKQLRCRTNMPRWISICLEIRELLTFRRKRLSKHVLDKY